jgi:hypothetical protein
MMSYPVTFEAEHVERRSRSTVFLRLILAIPLLIWGYLYGIAAALAVIGAWFAIVITGRYPKSLYSLVAGYIRFAARSSAYATLLCDGYPPFGGGDKPSYPVRVQFAGPLPRYSRVKTLFRFILAIPVSIIQTITAVGLQVLAFVAWPVIVVIGKLPGELFDTMEFAHSYTTRAQAYLYLLTETYPVLQPEATPVADIGGHSTPRAQVAGPTVRSGLDARALTTDDDLIDPNEAVSPAWRTTGR